MDIGNILRIMVLVLATGAMLLGIAVMAGLLVPASLPEQFRFLFGIVVFLYGAYRFAVAYYRNRKEPGE